MYSLFCFCVLCVVLCVCVWGGGVCGGVGGGGGAFVGTKECFSFVYLLNDMKLLQFCFLCA